MESWQLDAVSAKFRQPEVLRSDDGASRIILIELPAGEALTEHQVHEHALAFVVSGELEVSAGSESSRLRAPALAHFAPAERHEVRAVEDARLVLALSPWPGPGHPSLAAREAE
ncbi:MAG: cupin domain-containing protein [Actinobacteria bacterium]|nr:MAG: cupin domain-containing protein [Actinomycetota bacterium]